MMKAFISTLLAFCLVLMMAIPAGAEAAYPLPLVSEETALTIGMPNPVAVEDMDTNFATLWVEEQTGLDLQFDMFPANAGEAAQKLEIMVSADDDLPDLLWGFGLSDIAIYRYGSNGIFVDLLPYYDEYSCYIRKQFEDPANTYDLKATVLSPDGGMYSVARWQPNTHMENPYNMFINKAWLDTLGLEEPMTTEEFRNVLQAFKDNDPNGNGATDEVPCTGGTGWNQNPIIFLMNSFVFTDPSHDYLIAKDGQLSVAYNTDAWREGLRYIRGLVEDELLSPLAFTQDGNQLAATIQNPDGPVVGAFTAGSAGGTFGTYPYMYDYMVQSPLKGPEGVQYSAFAVQIPVPQGHVTASCEKPELAFQLMDFLWNRDASMTIRYGEKGVDWNYAKGDEELTYKNLGYPPYFVYISETGAVQNRWWNVQTPMSLPYEVGNGEVSDGSVEFNPQQILGDGKYKMAALHPDEFIVKILYTQDQADDINDIRATLKSYVDESMVRFALGDMDIEKDWDAYLNELNIIGLDHFLEVAQEAYSAQ